MQSKISSVIFDFGGVLVNWNPIALYIKIFNGDEVKANWFIDEVCTFVWHVEQDKGRLVKDAVAEKVKEFPEYEKEIKWYYSRWEESFLGAINENVEVLTELYQQQKYKLFGLTNWPDELFPIGQRLFPFFDYFIDIVVSGAVKMIKPNPAIFSYTLNRFKITDPHSTIFIDDSINNIKAASAMGINCIHYRNGVNIKDELKKLGVKF